VIDPSRPDVLYAALWDRQRTPWQFTEAGDGSGIYKSVDAGRTWQKLSGGLPQGDTVGRIGLAVARSQPDTVYATIDHWAELPDALRDLGDRPLSPQRLRTMSKEDFLKQDPEEIENFIRGADLPVELGCRPAGRTRRQGSAGAGAQGHDHAGTTDQPPGRRQRRVVRQPHLGSHRLAHGRCRRQLAPHPRHAHS